MMTTLDGRAVHALSNHLAVILGFIELVLAQTKPDDPRRKDLLEIRDAAREAARKAAETRRRNREARASAGEASG